MAYQTGSGTKRPSVAFGEPSSTMKRPRVNEWHGFQSDYAYSEAGGPGSDMGGFPSGPSSVAQNQDPWYDRALEGTAAFGDGGSYGATDDYNQTGYGQNPMFGKDGSSRGSSNIFGGSSGFGDGGNFGSDNCDSKFYPGAGMGGGSHQPGFTASGKFGVKNNDSNFEAGNSFQGANSLGVKKKMWGGNSSRQDFRFGEEDSSSGGLGYPFQNASGGLWQGGNKWGRDGGLGAESSVDYFSPDMNNTSYGQDSGFYQAEDGGDGYGWRGGFRGRGQGFPQGHGRVFSGQGRGRGGHFSFGQMASGGEGRFGTGSSLDTIDINQLEMAVQLVKEGFVPMSAYQGPPARGNAQGRGSGRGRGWGLSQLPKSDRVVGAAQRNKGRGQKPAFLTGNQRGGRGGNEQIKLQVKVSLPERVKTFCQYILNTPARINDIQTIENAVTGSRTGLKTEYVNEELMRQGGSTMFTGALSLSGIFLARCVAVSKKEVKHQCYKQALKLLKTSNVKEIMSQKDKGADGVRNEMKSLLEVPVTTSAAKLEMLQKLEVLLNHIKTSTTHFDNKVAELEVSFVTSKCGLKYRCELELTFLGRGTAWFKATVYAGDIAIARSSGSNKKQAKLNTYTKALTVLRSKSASEIMKGIPNDFDLPCQGCSSPDSLDYSPQALKWKFETLITRLKDVQADKADIINILDSVTCQLQISPTIIYRKGSGSGNDGGRTCDLYLGSILVASGQGDKRQDTQLSTYKKALCNLQELPVDHFLTKMKRLTNEDRLDPNTLDVCVKGPSQYYDSNIRRMKHMNLYSETLLPIDHLVIMEHIDWAPDRRRHAFCILNHSASLCSLLLSWTVEPYLYHFRCKMELQNTQIGEAYARSKNGSRNLAAADALFRLYQTYPVIQVVAHREDVKFWIEAATIYEEVKKLQEAGNGETSPAAGASTDQEGVNPYFVQVIEKRFKQYIEEESLEDLVFGVGLTAAERKEIINISKKLNLRHILRTYQEKGYIAFSHRKTPTEIVRLLRARPELSGKYSLIPPSSLPTRDELNELLLTKEQVEVQAAAQSGQK